jgi:hypothetical protein
MAFVDIGRRTAQAVFVSQRNLLNYANFESRCSGTWDVQRKECVTALIHGCGHRSPEESRRRERHCEEQHNRSVYSTSVNLQHKRGCDEICWCCARVCPCFHLNVEAAAVVGANTAALVLYDAFRLCSEVTKSLDYFGTESDGIRDTLGLEILLDLSDRINHFTRRCAGVKLLADLDTFLILFLAVGCTVGSKRLVLLTSHRTEQ